MVTDAVRLAATSPLVPRSRLGTRQLKGIGGEPELVRVGRAYAGPERSSDLVCLTDLDLAAAAARLTWRCTGLQFCSNDCLCLFVAFVAAPEWYANGSASARRAGRVRPAKMTAAPHDPRTLSAGGRVVLARVVHLMAAALWIPAAVGGLWAARRVRRGGTRLRLYLLVGLGFVVGATTWCSPPPWSTRSARFTSSCWTSLACSRSS